MKITVVGTGYVGLVTGTCFAESGNQVTCVDIDEAKVKKMQSGTVPIYEPDLETLFHRNIQEDRLHFTTSLNQGVKEAEIIFLALPTPPAEDGSADLSYVLDVADKLGKILDHYAVIVDKSTVPIGTADLVREHIARNAKTKFDVVSNPEFLREGFAVRDFMEPDRVVVGTNSAKARELMEQLYKPFLREGNPILFMDERSAEMTKYAANSFLATKISFINEIANICESVGADSDAVRLGVGSDPRIGNRFLMPGIGYGGSCFPKDVLALQKIATENNYSFRILEAVITVNSQQNQRLVTKIKQYFNDDLTNKTFALWGLAFKPDTDDIRESAALKIMKQLTDAGAKVVAYDPEAMDVVRKQVGERPGFQLAPDMYSATKGADALIIATEWPIFTTPDLDRLKKSLKHPVVFDGRNLHTLNSMQKHGFYYASIGRKTVGANHAQ